MTNGGERGEAPHLRVVPGGVPDEASPDDLLVSSFLDGDDTAFEDLVRRHEGLVLRLVRRFANDSEDARDLCQRTFVRVIEAARWTFRGSGEERVPFKRWLVKIAMNLARNHARDNNRWARAPQELLEAEQSHLPGALVALLEAERAARVRRAILWLPRRQREVVALRLDAELPFSEIAAALGITENSARVSFHHAAVRLRDLARSEDPEEKP
jgi:RNA polymerase sigma-70 factor (ECF subfamily)